MTVSHGLSPVVVGYYLKRLILFMILAVFFFFVVKSSFAAGPTPTPCPDGTAVSDFGCIHTDPVLFVTDIYAIGIWLIGFVGILFMIIGGYFIMTSRGNVEQLARGKSFIFYSIAGILLAVFGFVFIEIITGQILKIPGFG